MAGARISPWRRMRRSRARSNGLGRFFAAQFSAGCTTNMSGFDCRQAQHQFRTRNDHIKAQRTRTRPNENAAKSTNLIDMLPLITVWLQVRVLPGPPKPNSRMRTNAVPRVSPAPKRRTALQDHAANGARQIRQNVVIEAVAGGLSHAQATCRRACGMRDAGLGRQDEAATARGEIAEVLCLDPHDGTVGLPAGPVIDKQIEQ